MMILPDMMSWPHFIQLPKMRNLPLNEQMYHYNRYLAEQQALYEQVTAAAAAAAAGAGGSGGTPIQETPSLPSNCIEFTVDTSDGTAFDFNFNTTGPVNFTIDWGDGTTHEDSGFGGSYSESHTYPDTNQQYVARICFDDPTIVTSLEFVGND